MLRSYLPILVFAGLGIAMGTVFAIANAYLGPKKSTTGPVARRHTDAYESGIPTEVSRTFRFGITFYLVAMLFILFDIEVVFLYPVGVILKAADSVFVLVEVIVFIFLLFVAFIYVWRKGALDWR